MPSRPPSEIADLPQPRKRHAIILIQTTLDQPHTRIPETAMMESMGGGVLDTRLRGDDEL
jgi:transposase